MYTDIILGVVIGLLLGGVIFAVTDRICESTDEWNPDNHVR